MVQRLSIEKIQEIQDLYQDGLNTIEIAKKTGISQSTCWKYTNLNPDDEDYLRDTQVENAKNLVSKLLNKRLFDLGRNQAWLSKVSDVSNGAVSRHVNGEALPRKSILKRYFVATDVPYNSITDLLEDPKFKAVKICQGLITTEEKKSIWQMHKNGCSIEDIVSNLGSDPSLASYYIKQRDYN